MLKKIKKEKKKVFNRKFNNSLTIINWSILNPIKKTT